MTFWGMYMQNGHFEEIDNLGSQLSLALGCPVHYPARNKPIFECKHGVDFPRFAVEGGDWEALVRYHEERKDDMYIRR